MKNWNTRRADDGTFAEKRLKRLKGYARSVVFVIAIFTGRFDAGIILTGNHWCHWLSVQKGLEEKLTMAEININDLKRYDFENAHKGDMVVVATINYGELQSFEMCSVKSVSPKRRDVTLDNGLKYSENGYEYGRGSFSRISHCVLVDNAGTREMAKAYMEQRDTARKIMAQIREINTERLMKSTNDNCRMLSLILDEILEVGD